MYASENNQQLEERYDQWAKEYDEDLESDFGYVMPRIAAETFQQFVPTESKVLDAGAGTGMVGVELNRLGFTNIDAMDMSQGMLDEADRKGVYSNFYQMVMGEPLDMDTGSYDAVIGVGVLTLG
ncbi:MAG: class I SAM-dependent methyltransferase, partial [Dehalococcoidia bacterium]|nr:class I SAM-dependent methyltransferase [Dehalococcoidia bacterium]